MTGDKIPITILAGSDLRPGELPESGAAQHPLAAYKGAAVQIGGRPILQLLVERLRTCPELDPITVAGPESVYREVVPDLPIVDTDADVATNIRAAVDDFLARHPEGALGFIACDVLPDPDELRAVLDDYHAAAPCDIWFPLARVPDDPGEIGAFGWKPRYGIVPEPGADPVRILPGHLLIADPRALRLPLMLELLGIAYRTRNKPIGLRRRAMLRAVLIELLRQDFLHLFAFRLPDLTWKVVTSGLVVADKLRSGSIERREAERHLGRILIKARHRRRHPERGVRMPILDALTLAEDVDTEEEARQLAALVEARRTRE